ncbi:hypothetical protein LSH36_79g07008 [Paralvinella palmiformis]|uniref:G-protein coupled receptors family 3 profile domain-containing protein n=1 Tax=Paralvinella palmiformis TaxID=53620 RepID=A0AAD9NAU6_9ANNE|nr:hypothetical protein LSH36_79g07008 [Paralvinella palmiformis]
MPRKIRFPIQLLVILYGGYIRHTTSKLLIQDKYKHVVLNGSSPTIFSTLSSTDVVAIDGDGVTTMSMSDVSDTVHEIPRENIPLYIMSFSSLTVSTNGWSSAGVIPALQMAIHDINKRKDILLEYELFLLIKDSKCDEGTAIQSFYQYISSLPVKIILLGGGCSVSTVPVARTAPYFGLTQMKDARIIFFSGYERSARKVFCQVYLQGAYGARYQWIIPGWYNNNWMDVNDTICTNYQIKEAAMFVISIIDIKGDVTGMRTVSGMTYAEYEVRYFDWPTLEHYGYNAYHPNGYDAVWAIALALNSTAQIIAHDNITEIINGSVQVRPKRLDDFQYRDTPDIATSIVRAMEGVKFHGVSGPISFDVGEIRATMGLSQTQGDSPPKSTTEPVFVTTYKNDILVICACVLAGVGVLLAILFLSFNIKNREHKHIKMSSPRLNNVIIFGMILAYITVMLFGLDGQFIPDDNMPKICTIGNCSCNYFWWWITAIWFVNGLLLVFGCFLAWETRNVRIPGLNDSRFIGLCVYNVVIMCIVGVTVTLALPERDDIRYAFQAACIMFCAYSSLCMLFVPKIRHVLRHPDEADTNRADCRTNTSSTFKYTIEHLRQRSRKSQSDMDDNLSSVTEELREKDNELAELRRKHLQLERVLNDFILTEWQQNDGSRTALSKSLQKINAGCRMTSSSCPSHIRNRSYDERSRDISDLGLKYGADNSAFC